MPKFKGGDVMPVSVQITLIICVTLVSIFGILTFGGKRK